MIAAESNQRPPLAQRLQGSLLINLGVVKSIRGTQEVYQYTQLKLPQDITLQNAIKEVKSFYSKSIDKVINKSPSALISMFLGVGIDEDEAVLLDCEIECNKLRTEMWDSLVELALLPNQWPSEDASEFINGVDAFNIAEAYKNYNDRLYSGWANTQITQSDKDLLRVYRTGIKYANTFEHQQTALCLHIADTATHRYIISTDSTDLPLSAKAIYELVTLSLEEILEVDRFVASPTADLVLPPKAIYKTEDKTLVVIPGWAPIPAGYTDLVPKEFDRWDGSLWITDLPARLVYLKAKKLQQINEALESALSQLRVEYPESEIMSWTKQETEARGYILDPLANTPMIDLISDARGIDKTLLVGKVIEKSDAYSAAVGMAIGRRQMLEDQVNKFKVGQEKALDKIKF